MEGSGQGAVVSHATVASASAARLVEIAVAEAARNGWAVAAAVVDRAGAPLALIRMDDATPLIAEFALDKAYTAATLRRSTESYYERLAGSPSLALGFGNRPRLMVWGGGLPIVRDGQVLGGIGVSGALSSEDVACARVALEALGFGWER